MEAVERDVVCPGNPGGGLLDRLCYGNLYDGARGLARRRIFRVSIRLEVTLS